MLNPALIRQLESYGMTNDHLEQLLAGCQRGKVRTTWHTDHHGNFAKVEVTYVATPRDSRSMRELTQVLQKDH